MIDFQIQSPSGSPGDSKFSRRWLMIFINTNITMSNVTAADAWTSVVNVFGDVVYVDIQNAVSLENTYCFNLNLDSPGPKVFFIFI